MKFAVFPLILWMVCLSALHAQPNKKVGPALSKFLNTSFMMKFRDLRIEAESASINVQSRKDEFKPADLMRLRSAYDQTASRANSILENIKQDFLNGKKLKSIAQFPDMYSDGLSYKLQELSDFYTANFQQVLADTQVKNVDGSAVLLLVVELISLSKGLSDYFAAIHREARQYTELHLQENLVQPYRWRYWDELSGSTSPYEKFEKSSQVAPTFQPGDDLLDRQIQRMTEKAATIEFKSGNSESDSFNPPAESNNAQGTDFQYDNWTPDSTATQQNTNSTQGTKVLNPGSIQNAQPQTTTPQGKPAPATPSDRQPKSQPANTKPQNGSGG